MKASQHAERYPATWMTNTAPYLAYRVMPKCGCSSVGQILHYLDHGSFHDGLIHDAYILKWQSGSDRIVERFATQPVVRFTLVRNPYKRLLSAFADKILGFTRHGRRYRRGAIHQALHAYNVRWGPNADVIENFRGFVRFVADTIHRRHKMTPDLHWSPCFRALQFSVRQAPTWELDYIGRLESFREDIAQVARLAAIDVRRLPTKIPRENTTSLPAIAISDFYGPHELDMVRQAYADDFRFFGYSLELDELGPIAPIQLDEVNAALRCSHPTQQSLSTNTSAD